MRNARRRDAIVWRKIWCARNPKTSKVDSLPSHLRINPGLKRRSGAHDWVLAKLHNNIKASQRTKPIPRLIGCGFIKHNGLVNAAFLAYVNSLILQYGLLINGKARS